jgi:hypothetical protein
MGNRVMPITFVTKFIRWFNTRPLIQHNWLSIRLKLRIIVTFIINWSELNLHE